LVVLHGRQVLLLVRSPVQRAYFTTTLMVDMADIYIVMPAYVGF
jgi:hypothetical protein